MNGAIPSGILASSVWSLNCIFFGHFPRAVFLFFPSLSLRVHRGRVSRVITFGDWVAGSSILKSRDHKPRRPEERITSKRERELWMWIVYANRRVRMGPRTLPSPFRCCFFSPSKIECLPFAFRFFCFCLYTLSSFIFSWCFFFIRARVFFRHTLNDPARNSRAVGGSTSRLLKGYRLLALKNSNNNNAAPSSREGHFV